jgi:hypothetical protein
LTSLLFCSFIEGRNRRLHFSLIITIGLLSFILLSICEKLKHSHRVCYVYFFDLCSNQHVPGFITQAEQLKAKGVDEILLISGMFLKFLFLSVKIPWPIS